MCAMIAPILGAVMSVATAVVSFQAAQQDYEAKSEQWRQNYSNALSAGRDEQRQLSLRMLQEDDAFHQKARATNIEGAEVAAEAEASASAAGLSGVSLDNLLVGIRRKVADKMNADETNYMNTAAQLQAENNATINRIDNRINSVQRPIAPNPLGYVLKGIGGAIGAFG